MGQHFRVLPLDDEQPPRVQIDMACDGPAGLEARVKRSRLEIGPPQLDQIVRLWEPAPTGPADDRLVAVKKENQNLLTSIPAKDREEASN